MLLLKGMTEQLKNQQYAVMQTALKTAFPKVKSDIPFAKSIYTEAAALANECGFDIGSIELSEHLAVELVGRHKAIDIALSRTGIGQVVELGAGLSPRSLSPAFRLNRYLEIDFPPMAELKRRVLSRLAKAPGRRITVVGANISDVEQLHTALCQELLPTPTAVICEGLLWYLPWEDKARLGSEVLTLLQKHGGCWITSDCPPTQTLALSPKDVQERASIGRSALVTSDAKFLDANHFVEFFSDLGLSVEVLAISNLADVDALAAQFHTTPSEVAGRLDSYASIAILRSSDTLKEG